MAHLEATGSLDRLVTRNESDFNFRSKLTSDLPVRSGNDCDCMLIRRYVPTNARKHVVNVDGMRWLVVSVTFINAHTIADRMNLLSRWHHFG